MQGILPQKIPKSTSMTTRRDRTSTVYLVLTFHTSRKSTQICDSNLIASQMTKMEDLDVNALLWRVTPINWEDSSWKQLSLVSVRVWAHFVRCCDAVTSPPTASPPKRALVFCGCQPGPTRVMLPYRQDDGSIRAPALCLRGCLWSESCLW